MQWLVVSVVRLGLVGQRHPDGFSEGADLEKCPPDKPDTNTATRRRIHDAAPHPLVLNRYFNTSCVPVYLR